MVDQHTFKAAIDWYKQHGQYEDLGGKPSINGVELGGNKTTEDLHIEGGVTITGITMRVDGTRVIFSPAESEDYIKATLVEGHDIRFIK